MGNQVGDISNIKDYEMDPLTNFANGNFNDEVDLREYEIFEPESPSPVPPKDSNTANNQQKNEFEMKINSEVQNSESDEIIENDKNENKTTRGIVSKTSGPVLQSAVTCSSQLARFSSQLYENESLIQLIVEWADRFPSITQEAVFESLSANTVINSEGIEVVRYAFPNGKYFDFSFEMGSNWFWPAKWVLEDGPDPLTEIAIDSSVATLGLGILIEGIFSTYQIFKNRKIKDEKRRRFENVKVVAKNSGSVLGSSIGVAAGTIIIPVPILGGLVGSVVGGFVGRYGGGKFVKRIYRKQRKDWKKEELEKEVRLKILSEMKKEISNNQDVFSKHPKLKEKLFGDLEQEENEEEENFVEWEFFQPEEDDEKIKIVVEDSEEEKKEEIGEEGDTDSEDSEDDDDDDEIVE